jgi:Uma2 family endonuclease
MHTMTVSAEPVRLDFDDYVRYTEMHPDGDFELIHGVIYKFAPEGDPHLLTRHGIHDFLMQTLDLTRYTAWNEASIPAPGWSEGPKPDNAVSIGPRRVNGRYASRPKTDNIALTIEVSSSSRIKDIGRAILYASLSIPEYWMVDLLSGIVGVYREPIAAGEIDSKYRWFRSYGRNETITSSAVDNLIVETNFLLELAQP